MGAEGSGRKKRWVPAGLEVMVIPLSGGIVDLGMLSDCILFLLSVLWKRVKVCVLIEETPIFCATASRDMEEKEWDERVVDTQWNSWTPPQGVLQTARKGA